MREKNLKIYCKKGRLLPESTLDWFRFHFPSDNSFDGFFQICYRGKWGFRTLWTGNQENMEEFLEKMKILSKSDYYISANSTTSLKRKKEDLFALQNIVIDLDCHSDLFSTEEKNDMLETFLFRFKEFDDLIPSPHSIVWTGRGLQLWWSLDAFHSKCQHLYHGIKDYFETVIDLVLEEYPSELSNLTLDLVASNNDVGLFRLPGSRNPKARREVFIERTEVKERYTLQYLLDVIEEHKEELDFTPLYQQNFSFKNLNKKLRNSLKENDPFAALYEPEDLKLLEGASSFTYFRIKQLLQLRFHRDNERGAEERNNYSLLVYSALRASFSHIEAWKRLQFFNKGFKQPMTEAELNNVISSAQYKDGYKFRNRAVLKFLNITNEEQQIIGLFTREDEEGFESSSKNISRDHFNKLKKEVRDAKAKQYCDEGKTYLEISKLLSVAEGTIVKILKPYQQGKKKDIVRLILENLEENLTLKEIKEKFNLKISISTMSRYVKNVETCHSPLVV